MTTNPYDRSATFAEANGSPAKTMSWRRRSGHLAMACVTAGLFLLFSYMTIDGAYQQFFAGDPRAYATMSTYILYFVLICILFAFGCSAMYWMRDNARRAFLSLLAGFALSAFVQSGIV